MIVSVQDRALRDDPGRAHLSTGVLVDWSAVMVLVELSVGRIDRAVDLDIVVAPQPLGWDDVVERIPVVSVSVFEDDDRNPFVLGLELASRSRYGGEPRIGRTDDEEKNLRIAVADPRRELHDIGAIASDSWTEISPEQLEEIARHERGQSRPQWHAQLVTSAMSGIWPFCLLTRGGCS
jgi:hypothetical protein